MGISKPLWIIAIVSVIFLIGGIIFLTIPPPVPAGVTVTTGEVTDHNLNTSVKVTLEGEKDSYSMIMTGPEGTEVDSEFITETQMIDGKQSVWMGLVGESRSKVAAKPGTYSLVVINSSENKVYEKSFGPYSGTNLSVIDISVSTPYDINWGYWVDEIVLKVKNDGDLPAYILGMDVELDNSEERKESSYIEEKGVILPGRTTTITSSGFILLDMLDEGDYIVSIKLRGGEGRIVATYTTAISIP